MGPGEGLNQPGVSRDGGAPKTLATEHGLVRIKTPRHCLSDRHHESFSPVSSHQARLSFVNAFVNAIAKPGRRRLWASRSSAWAEAFGQCRCTPR
jgi:hypothetical protein